MQVTVFGASGHVGQRVAEEALAQGHTVVAFVHSRNPFENAANDKLSVITGDVSDATKVADAIHGSQAVISALGSWGTKHKDVLVTGMRAILPSMQAEAIDRIVTVTGSGAHWSGDKPKLFARLSRLLILCVAPRILRDGEEHLRLLEASQLNWTCVRSPVMRDAPQKSYTLTSKAPSVLSRVSYGAVAQSMVDLLGTDSHQRQAPYIRTIVRDTED